MMSCNLRCTLEPAVECICSHLQRMYQDLHLLQCHPRFSTGKNKQDHEIYFEESTFLSKHGKTNCVRLMLFRPHLWFLWGCLIDFRQETLQLRAVAHELVIHPISLVQQGIDVSHRLHGESTVKSSCIKGNAG